MPSDAGAVNSDVSIESRIHHDFLTQMQSSRFNGVLKLRWKYVLRTLAASSTAKRPRVCSDKEELTEVAQDDTTLSILRALRKVSDVPLRGLELRHARITASHIGCSEKEEKATDREIKQKKTTAPTLYSYFSLGKFASLHTLDLECNKLGDDGVTYLSQWCLPQLKFLHSLFLASNGFGMTGMESIVQYVERYHMCDAVSNVTATNSGLHGLETVGLSNNAICVNKESTELIFRLLLACRRVLRRLHMNHVHMSTASSVSLLELVTSLSEEQLLKFPHLQTIYIKQNEINKDEFRSIQKRISAVSPAAAAAAQAFLV
ncbi:Leucine-rich repeat [Trypanosoma melophagium]|uniref:Leucine-rich repeat n=1 Tax=Trypanosoma melophagium TaxID=715481 RepID=UPI00351A5D0C|nr:Leucine-rich repeat [Trypanosoma melophagium]